MAENILRKLVSNSQMAIDDGTYDIDCNLEKSSKDFKQIIKTNSPFNENSNKDSRCPLVSYD